jgi:hypothetical protein
MKNAKKNYLKLHGMLLLAVPITTVFSMEEEQKNNSNIQQQKHKSLIFQQEKLNQDNQNKVFQSEILNDKNIVKTFQGLDKSLSKFRNSTIGKRIFNKSQILIQQQQNNNSKIFQVKNSIYSNIYLQQQDIYLQQQENNQQQQQQSINSELKEYQKEQKQMHENFNHINQQEQIESNQEKQQQVQQNPSEFQNNQFEFQQQQLYDQDSFVYGASNIFSIIQKKEVPTYNIEKLFNILRYSIKISDQEIAAEQTVMYYCEKLKNIISGSDTTKINTVQEQLTQNQEIEGAFREGINNLIQQELKYRTCTKGFSAWYNNTVDRSSKKMLEELYKYKTQGFNLSDHAYVPEEVKKIFNTCNNIQEALNKLQQEEQQQQQQYQYPSQLQNNQFQQNNQQQQQQYSSQLQYNQFQQQKYPQQQQNNKQEEESQSVVYFQKQGLDKSTIENNRCCCCLELLLGNNANKKITFQCNHFTCITCYKQLQNNKCPQCRQNL